MAKFGPAGLAPVAHELLAAIRSRQGRLSKPPLKSAPPSGSSRFHRGTASAVAVEATAAASEGRRSRQEPAVGVEPLSGRRWTR